MELNKIYNMDCLEGMEEMPDKSIDLIVTDPPYNIGKAKWDKIDNYIEWMGTVFKECERVLKDNGSFYFFHNDMPQIAQLMEWLRLNTLFIYNSFIIWDKGDFRALSWKNPSEANNLRSWFNTCEYCLAYNKSDGVRTEWDRTGLERVKLDINNFTTLRKYSYELLCYIGGAEQTQNSWREYSTTGKLNTSSIVGRRSVFDKVGGKADHFMRYGSTQWDLCTEETYNELIEKFGVDKWEGFREYEDLRLEYEDLRYVHNLDANHNNLWNSTDKRNDGKLHPTQKPADIIERIIKTSSNENATVLDCFMGSGTTAIACINTNRNYIGFELDKGYFDIANKRIQDAKG